MRDFSKHVTDCWHSIALPALQVEGYAVLRNALGARRRKEFIDGFWHAMRRLG